LLALSLGGFARAHADDVPSGHRPTAWADKRFAKHKSAALAFGTEYRGFLAAHKTVREVVSAAIALAETRGFRDLFAAKRPRLAPGAKVFAAVHGKLVAFAVVGKQPFTDGTHVVAAHVDSVRLDLKQRPLYADANVALLETHYYGSPKYYHWLSTPLELRGVVVKRGGEVVRVAIGDDPDEPVLVIPDLAVHESAAVDREEGEDVPGEKLDPILSSTPAAKVADGQDPFAAEAERLLATAYGIAAADLATAELELVPATSPRDVGLDRALVGGYGQDDRACVYAALRAILDLGTPPRTAIVVLVDKEEVGSAGNTGAQSTFLRRVVAELLEATGGRSTELVVDRVLGASMIFSADVTGAVHPHYPALYDAKNAAFLGAGVVWDQSAIHAEVMGYVRKLFDDAGIAHQPATWTKVDVGGGDTVLPYFTRYGMSGLDVMIPLLSMHAPYELVSKADLYEGYRAYRAFLGAAQGL
jgi:aspartyl aminopeptidase